MRGMRQRKTRTVFSVLGPEGPNAETSRDNRSYPRSRHPGMS